MQRETAHEDNLAIMQKRCNHRSRYLPRHRYKNHLLKCA
nr:MAG TPA: hypothetical protein [Caudoviricetes sp.]